MKETKFYSVVIVDDDHGFIRFLEGLVNSVEVFKCVGTFQNDRHALRFIPLLKPDLVLMDLIPNPSGFGMIRSIKDLAPDSVVLVHTGDDRTPSIVNSFEQGADGYVLKSSSVVEVAAAMEQVMRHGAPMTPLVARKLIGHLRTGRRREVGLPKLTAAQRAILDQLAKGLSNKEIAEACHISFSTVQWHLKQIFDKLNVDSRTRAVVKYLRMQGCGSGGSDSMDR